MNTSISNMRADVLLSDANKLSQIGAYKEARLLLQEILDLIEIDNQRRSWALHAMAHTLINEGEPKKAGNWFTQITELTGADARALCEAYVAIGYEQEAVMNWQKARESFERATSILDGVACHRASACFHLAKIYYNIGDTKRAKQEFELFLKIEQPYPNERQEAKKILTTLI